MATQNYLENQLVKLQENIEKAIRDAIMKATTNLPKSSQEK